MSSILILFFSFLIIVCSTLGFGSFFSKLLLNKNYEEDYGYFGLTGLFFLIIFSYFSHFFLPHNYIHNLIIIFIGLLLFFYFLYKKKKKFNHNLTIIFFILFIGLILFKTHDDFSYYHFPYTYYLTNQKLIIGIGSLNHGFKTPSSIFYLNSLFYIPFIKYYSFYFSTALFMGFSVSIFLTNIYKKIRDNEIDHFLYINLLFLLFILIFFYRFQEHGTDRSAQILILLLFVELLVFIKFKKNYYKNLNYLFLLMGLIISLKAFYVTYALLLVPISIILYRNNKLFLYKKILKNYFFLSFCFLIFLILATNFFVSGCLVYPISHLCFDLPWSAGPQQAETLNRWYQLWSKAGASPNYRVADPEIYIQNFNWLTNWIDNYFFNKVSDFIFGIILLQFILVIIFFKKKRLSIELFFSDKIIYLSFGLLLLFWFYNHPALRYGGYCLLAIVMCYPISLLLSKFYNKAHEVKKKINLLIIFTFLIFISRNLDRISNEMKKYNYNPFINAFYQINKNHLRVHVQIQSMLDNYFKCINEESSCKKTSTKLTKLVLKNYMFILEKK